MEQHAFSVSQLNEYVHGLLGRDPLLQGIRVQGELSGFKRHHSGHLYFSIKDRESIIRCVMFRSAAQYLRFQPRDGMEVLLLADATLYVRDGQFQLYVQAMQEQGEGELYRRFLLLKTKLEAKGYFDAARKRPLPLLPRCVGIVTSGTGAALQDILQIIRRRFPAMHIEICPVQVQGDTAAKEICAAIRAVNTHGTASVMIVGRGGGSMEDLAAFNDERVAHAIYESHIPVVSAVGHETDITIADYVADLRAPTPSAAAELCVPDYYALMQQIDRCMQRLPISLGKSLCVKRDKVRLLLQAKGFSIVEHSIADAKRTTVQMRQALHAIVDGNLCARREALETLLLRLQSRSPETFFASGFVALQDEKGQAIASASQLHADMLVQLTLRDGDALARIQSIRNR